MGEKGDVYVLDEPTSGLHLADVEQLLGLLDRLVDSGKSVIVIEHHQAVMAHADWIIDLGPGAGHDGGRIVFEGTPPISSPRARRSPASTSRRTSLVDPRDAIGCHHLVVPTSFTPALADAHDTNYADFSVGLPRRAGSASASRRVVRPRDHRSARTSRSTACSDPTWPSPTSSESRKRRSRSPVNAECPSAGASHPTRRHTPPPRSSGSAGRLRGRAR